MLCLVLLLRSLDDMLHVAGNMAVAMLYVHVSRQVPDLVGRSCWLLSQSTIIWRVAAPNSCNPLSYAPQGPWHLVQ